MLDWASSSAYIGIYLTLPVSSATFVHVRFSKDNSPDNDVSGPLTLFWPYRRASASSKKSSLLLSCRSFSFSCTDIEGACSCFNTGRFFPEKERCFSVVGDGLIRLAASAAVRFSRSWFFKAWFLSSYARQACSADFRSSSFSSSIFGSVDSKFPLRIAAILWAVRRILYEKRRL